MDTNSKSIFKETVGVIGGGSFGTAVANILAENQVNVLLYIRTSEKAIRADTTRINVNQKIHKNIQITNDLIKVANTCEVIFPVVPSLNFRDMILQLAPHLKPYHILIHGTKGFDLLEPDKLFQENRLITRDHVKTISEVIKEETPVLRIGCLAGPNLARELSQKKPAASVIASQFDEVISIGQRLLKNDRFMVYGSHDLLGTELCGILKNIIALGAGTIHGMKLGENAKSLFISRGLVEMIYIGKALGGNEKAFLGLAGVGDLIVTCTSPLSRNFTVGQRLAEGENIETILNSMEEVAEGVKTTDIIYKLAEHLKMRFPITETLYRILHKDMTIAEAHKYLMSFPFRSGIDFLYKSFYEDN